MHTTLVHKSSMIHWAFHLPLVTARRKSGQTKRACNKHWCKCVKFSVLYVGRGGSMALTV